MTGDHFYLIALIFFYCPFVAFGVLCLFSWTRWQMLNKRPKEKRTNMKKELFPCSPGNWPNWSAIIGAVSPGIPVEMEKFVWETNDNPFRDIQFMVNAEIEEEIERLAHDESE